MNPPGAALEVRDLHKTLRPPRGLRKRFPLPFHLREASFVARPGESIALLGKNGAGKTTLLRLLAGLYAPSSGTIRVRGARSPIVGIGSPFSADLTVSEHLRAYGELAGRPLSPESVAETAGLTGYERQPIRWLSTGQRVRLGIACGLLLPADIYLVDEALAVCDPEFRAWAVEHLKQRCADGALLVLAGQDLLTARALCGRGLLLEGGCLTLDADYEATAAAFTTAVDSGAAGEAGVRDGSVLIDGVTALPDRPRAGESVRLRFRVRGLTGPFQLLFAVKLGDGTIVHSSRTLFRQAPGVGQGGGPVMLEAEVPALSLAAGRYRVAVSIADSSGIPITTREDSAIIEID